MPEVLTKYPKDALFVLKNAGMQCGVGAEQKILKNCPAKQFCSSPRGEICVYGLGDFSGMTQMGPSDIFLTGWESMMMLTAIFLIGIFVGVGISKSRREKRSV